MKDKISYIKLSINELKKVFFPTKKQVTEAYISVVFVVFVITLFLAGVDAITSWILSSIL